MAVILNKQLQISRSFLLYTINRRRIITMGKGKVRNRDKDWYDSEEDIFSPGTSPNLAGGYTTSAASYRGDSFSSRNFVAARQPVITPRNPMQENYLSLLENPNPPIVISTGPAGTSKTYLCNAVAIKKLLDGTYEKLIITRPAVSTDEDIGFLPGTLEDKMLPWVYPIYDVFHKFVSPSAVKNMITKGQIEICPLAFMRGRTFDNAFIIADEMQNSTPNQMLMMLTRIGQNSKMVITGDIQQHDRKYYDNGLKDFLIKLRNRPNSKFGLVEFKTDDVIRHPIIKDVLSMYDNNIIISNNMNY